MPSPYFLQRGSQCDCDKHLSFSISIVSSLVVASHYTHTVSPLFHLPAVFVPFPARSCLLTLASIVVPFCLFQPRLQNQYDWRIQAQSHSTHNFQERLFFIFYMKARSTHLFKDVSFTEFPSLCIVMALPVCTLIIRLTRESVECVGVNRMIYEDWTEALYSQQR